MSTLQPPGVCAWASKEKGLKGWIFKPFRSVQSCSWFGDRAGGAERKGVKTAMKPRIFAKKADFIGRLPLFSIEKAVVKTELGQNYR